ncbi:MULTISPECIES: ABC transporter permease [Providencia]|uniref:Permease component of an ABC superfamily ribose transporter n=1 Tax=Providencia heimbachae ATCC 35613 TaxID=1354272 RepID=A0A1B7JWF8_9GAMM|nr:MULTISPECIES: ABC transporter permease [Providencia]MBP6123039.1 ABC transporter permease [Providencia sp.]NIH24090.1 ABC transporter permease [Providencia heimbachae]OAT52236.1 permease component of an ABC superfamily ribose transporter [Providencia heimbachae ATCC 35613]QCJ71486.1 ABC transporter permease [Providencia heimbachae]SQH15058.1 Ribose transport system permease protein rbsC [Providencia heimbachae]
MVNWQKLRPQSVEGWLVWVIFIMVVFFTTMSPQFLTIQNLLDLSESYAVTGIFALGLFVVLVTGGIDISFAAVASVVQYAIATWLLQGFIASPTLSITLAILIGITFGLINAILIYSLNVVSIIITISMQSLLFGMLMWLTNGHSIYDLPDWWVDPVTILPFEVDGESYQIGLPLIVMLGIALLTWVLMNKTHIGRQLYAVGGSQESASRIGIRVSVIYLFAYGYLGAMAAIGGMLQTYRMSEVVPSALVGGELDVLAAAVLGGASLSGGRGSVIGTLMGVFLIGILKNGLNLIGVSNYFVNIVIGMVILVAICITHYKKRKETDVGFV